MKKIVVVDDQPVLTSIYRAKFSGQGFQVEVAADGELALEIIKRSQPDLVLLDLMLPKMGGLEVLKHLRELPAFKSMPVVVFSSAAQPKTVEDAWTAGATLVLSKSSTSPKQLVELVQGLLATPAAPGTVAEDSKPLAHYAGPTAAATGAGGILLIENNPDARAMVSHLLVAGHHRVTHAEGLNHASVLNQATRFDLVLTSRTICQGGFRTFAAQLKQSSPGLPLVMYSMDASAKEADEAIGDGATRILRTPGELLDLAAISTALISEARL